MARAEAERKRKLEIKSHVPAQTFFGPTTPQKQPPVEEVKSPESQKANIIKQSSPVSKNTGQNSQEEPPQVFKTPPRSQRLEKLRSGIPMTSPGGGSPETKQKPGLREDEILAELERNDNPQSPPMKVFKLLRSERLKQKRYIPSTNFICDDKPNSKAFSGDDLQEFILQKQQEELTRNDNPQSPPIKRFSQLRTEKILEAATRQPGSELVKTVTKENRTTTRQKTKLKLFGMISDNSSDKSDHGVEKSPDQVHQTQKDLVGVGETKEAKAGESDGISALAPLSLINQNTPQSSQKTPTKRFRFARHNTKKATESDHDKTELILNGKSEGNKASLESENNNLIDKKEESDIEEDSVFKANKSKSLNVSMESSSHQHQSTRNIQTSQKHQLSDEQTDSLQLVNMEQKSHKTFIGCLEESQEPNINGINLPKPELGKGSSKQIDQSDASGLKTIVKENTCRFAKGSKHKITRVRQEEEVVDYKEESTKEAGGSKPESGLSLASLEQDQITQLGNLHQLETSLIETTQAEAEITSPGSTQLNQYPNMSEWATSEDETWKPNELVDLTTKGEDPPNVSLKSKCKLKSLPVFSECFIPLVQLEKITELPFDINTEKNQNNITDLSAAVNSKTIHVVPLENEVQVDVISSGLPIKSLKQFGIKIKPLNYKDLNHLSNESKLQLFANKPAIRMSKIPDKPDNPKKSVKRNLSIELLLGNDEDVPMTFSKKPKLINNDLKLK